MYVLLSETITYTFRFFDTFVENLHRDRQCGFRSFQSTLKMAAQCVVTRLYEMDLDQVPSLWRNKFVQRIKGSWSRSLLLLTSLYPASSTACTLIAALCWSVPNHTTLPQSHASTISKTTLYTNTNFIQGHRDSMSLCSLSKTTEHRIFHVLFCSEQIRLKGIYYNFFYSGKGTNSIYKRFKRDDHWLFKLHLYIKTKNQTFLKSSA